jgi:hypothetical protein
MVRERILAVVQVVSGLPQNDRVGKKDTGAKSLSYLPFGRLRAGSLPKGEVV